MWVGDSSAAMMAAASAEVREMRSLDGEWVAARYWSRDTLCVRKSSSWGRKGVISALVVKESGEGMLESWW